VKVDIGHLRITELVEMVEQSKIALPEFQRDFTWKPSDTCDLLCSVARQWPIGSFLVMEGSLGIFEVRALEQAPALDGEPELIILDGQQRCTSFFHAFGPSAGDVVFHLTFPEDWLEFDDEQIRYDKRPAFTKRYPTLEKLASERVIPIADLHDDVQFERWKSYLPEEAREKAVAFRKNQVAGLKDLSIPVTRLSQEPDLAAIAKIFETINRTGKKLDTFELMVARLYPYDFKLRDRWDQAVADHPALVPFDDGGLEILKLIALRRYISDQNAGTAPAKKGVKGVKQSDVLALDPDTVKKEWDVVVDAYAAGLTFLRDRCGVCKPNLLPQPSIPLTLGYFCSSDFAKRAGFMDDLERWYWASCFLQTYAQAANTQVLMDAKALLAWQMDPAAVPGVVANFQISDDQLREGRRLNEILVKAIVGRQIALGAKDWASNDPVSTADTVELHHVFPADVLATLKGKIALPKDPILNFVGIAGSTNKRIRNESPGKVVGREDIEVESVRSHAIELDWLEKSEGESELQLVERFLDNRLDVIKKLIHSAVGA
jgi:hypothetical protein